MSPRPVTNRGGNAIANSLRRLLTAVDQVSRSGLEAPARANCALLSTSDAMCIAAPIGADPEQPLFAHAKEKSIDEHGKDGNDAQHESERLIDVMVQHVRLALAGGDYSRWRFVPPRVPPGCALPSEQLHLRDIRELACDEFAHLIRLGRVAASRRSEH